MEKPLIELKGHPVKQLIYLLWKIKLYVKYMFLVLLIAGCSSSTTTVRETEIEVKIPDIEATIIPEFKGTEESKIKIDSLLIEMPDDAIFEGTETIIDETGRKTTITAKVDLSKKDEKGKPNLEVKVSARQEPIIGKKKETEKISLPWYDSILTFFRSMIIYIVIGGMILGCVIFFIKKQFNRNG